MTLPGFTAETSLVKSKRIYHGQYFYGDFAPNQNGLPASLLPSQLNGMEDIDYGGESEEMNEVAGEYEETEGEEY